MFFIRRSLIRIASSILYTYHLRYLAIIFVSASLLYFAVSTEGVACDERSVAVSSTTSTTQSHYPNCSIDDRYNHDQFQPHFVWYMGQDVFQTTRGSGYFSVTPELPTGLSLNSSNGIITGSPVMLSNSRQYTITSVSNDLSIFYGYQSSWSFTAEVVVNVAPLTFDIDQIENQEWRLSENISLTLPRATGGIGDIKYSISHGLPNGISLRGNTISGRADESFSFHQFEEYIERQDCITMIENCSNVIDHVGTVTKRYMYLPLQSIKYLYPDEIYFNSYIGIPKIIPSKDTIEQNYDKFHSIIDPLFTWKDEDSVHNNSVQLREFYQQNHHSFDIMYSRNCPTDNFQSSPSYNQGEIYVNYCLINIHRYNNKRVSWQSISTTAARKRTRYEPSFKVNSNYDYYWIATDEAGRSAVLKFDVAILPAPSEEPVAAWEFSLKRQYWTTDMDISLELPSMITSSIDDDFTYTIEPELPNGLSIIDHIITGRLSKFPHTKLFSSNSLQQYIWTARNATGVTFSTSFSVQYLPRPKFHVEYTKSDIWRISEETPTHVFRRNTLGKFSLEVGQTVFLPLPLGWDGGKVGRYSINPRLPAGLYFDSSNSIIYGTPEEPQDSTNYRLTISSCRDHYLVTIVHCIDYYGGSYSSTFSSRAKFTIEIISTGNFVEGPSFGKQSIDEQDWELGSRINLELPRATGGTGSLQYYLSHSLPAGLINNQNQISGRLETRANSRIFNVSLDGINGIPNNLEIRILKKYLYKPWRWQLENSNTNYDIERRSLYRLAKDTTSLQSIVGLEVYLLDKEEARTLFYNIDPDFDYQRIFDLIDIQYSDYLLPGEHLEYIHVNEPNKWWDTIFSPNSFNDINLINHDFWIDKTYTYIWTVVDENNNIDQIPITVNIEPGSLPVFSEISNLILTNESTTTDADGSIQIRRFGYQETYELPQASGGIGTIKYRVEPSLFAGLEFDGVNTISGTLTGEQTSLRTKPSGEFITIAELRNIPDSTNEFNEMTSSYPWDFYRNFKETLEQTPIYSPLIIPPAAGLSRSDKFYLIAEDEHGNQNSIPFYLVIQPPNSIEDGNLPAVENLEWTAGEETEITLAPVEWIAEAFCYKITPDLPNGLIYTERTISGTPLESIEPTTYTYSAYHVPRQSLDTFQSCQHFEYPSEPTFNQEFELTVTDNTDDSIVSFGNETISDQVWKVDLSYSLALPSANGGTAPLSYTISPNLPAGITLQNSSISGIPNAVMTETEYTWTVADADDNNTSLTFDIAVVENPQPDFGTSVVGNQIWIQDTIILLHLPNATGDDRPLSYGLNPDLPTGLRLIGNAIAGTPTETLPETTYTWTATDTDGDTSTLTFAITIVRDLQPEFGTTSISDQIWTENQPVTLTLPDASGGNGTLTYQLTPALPTGLDLTNQTISGTPTQTMSETTYTWTVTDTNGDRVSLSFNITISGDLEPTFGASTVSDQVWTQNQAVTLTLPEASDGDGSITYTLSPALPTGLTLTGQTIVGSPTTTLPETAYTWTATDTDGDTVSLTFNITITETLEPSFGTHIIPAQVWIQNQPVGLILPVGSGGDGLLSYSLSPALPSGLTLTGNTITGSPTEVLPETTYSWAATDADGDQAVLEFTITITGDTVPTFGTQTIPDLRWAYDQTVNHTLPQATGGNGTLTYDLTTDLPAGLALTGTTISGTTTGTPSSTEYRWSVTDADGDTTHLEFTIRVGPEAPSEDFTRRWRVGDSIWIIFGGYEDNQPGWTYRIQPLDLAGNPAPNQTIPTFLTNEIDRILYGTPTPADLPPNTVRAGKIRWTATNPQGNIQQTQTLTWSLHPDLKPTFPNTPTPTYTWIYGEPLTNTWLPQAHSGDQPLTYTLTPPPPPGTQIIANPHNNTNQITGTPTQYILTPQTYIWTATDNDQHQNRDTTQTQIRIQVVPDRTPHFHPHQNTYNHLTIGHTYTNTYLQPQAHGGNIEQNTQTYHISPPLPTGLTLNPTNGTITGTYTGPPQTTTHTWTYTDSDNTQPETIIAIITITIQHPPQQIATIQPQNPTPHPRQTTHTQTQPNSIPTTTLPETPQTTQPSNSANTKPPTPQPTIPSSSTQNPQLRTTETAPTTQQTPTFTDTIGNTHQQNIQKLAQQGITQGCKPNHYCPNRPITRAEIATLLVKTLNLPPTHHNYFTDITDNTHQANINTLAHHQITQSCNPPHNTRYCPNRPITRAETATLLTRSFNLTPTKINYFTDIAGNTHQANINTLAHHQITQGCHYQEKIHNSRYCPNRPITRAETATLLIKTQQHQNRTNPT